MLALKTLISSTFWSTSIFRSFTCLLRADVKWEGCLEALAVTIPPQTVEKWFFSMISSSIVFSFLVNSFWLITNLTYFHNMKFRFEFHVFLSKLVFLHLEVDSFTIKTFFVHLELPWFESPANFIATSSIFNWILETWGVLIWSWIKVSHCSSSNKLLNSTYLLPVVAADSGLTLELHRLKIELPSRWIVKVIVVLNILNAWWIERPLQVCIGVTRLLVCHILLLHWILACLHILVVHVLGTHWNLKIRVDLFR